MFGLYGLPPAELAQWPTDAAQLSPLMPGALCLEALDPGALTGLAMLAPPGAVERRREMALALEALAPGAPFVILAPKDRGGQRLREELARFGCAYEETSKRHYRMCAGIRPAALRETAAAAAEGAPRELAELACWSQPGLFNWDRLDPGTALLIEHLPAFSGAGADFGCGAGLLARAALASPKVAALALVDVDRRAVEISRRNVADPRASFHWADLRAGAGFNRLDFVVMNPPFHEGGREDAGLGQTFLRRAEACLRKGGVCWLVANRHLPYEATLKPLFRRFATVAERGGYKIIEATK